MKGKAEIFQTWDITIKISPYLNFESLVQWWASNNRSIIQF